MFHAMNSAKRFGGTLEDYLPIHQFMDSSKGAIADNRHRALTHNAWFISTVIERVFGVWLEVEHAGRKKKVSTREVAEQHVMEDYGMRFIPSAQDFLAGIPYQAWMNNGEGGTVPPSFEAIKASEVRKRLNEHSIRRSKESA